MSDWQFFGFWEQYADWVDRADANEDMRFCVMAWLYELDEDPCYAATVQPQANGWMARIPGAEDEFWTVVCLYTIDESTSTVRCSAFVTLPKPEFDDGV